MMSSPALESKRLHYLILQGLFAFCFKLCEVADLEVQYSYQCAEMLGYVYSGVSSYFRSIALHYIRCSIDFDVAKASLGKIVSAEALYMFETCYSF